MTTVMLTAVVRGLHFLVLCAFIYVLWRSAF